MSRVLDDSMAPRTTERRVRNDLDTEPSVGSYWTWLTSAAVIGAVILAIWQAPTEATMGHAQRVLYVHVSVAWLSLLGFIIVAASGLRYLMRRNLAWDGLAQAAAEVGWVCSCLTLATGSLWAHSAWGTWWTWDPRLVTSFILWSIYGGYHLTRGSIDEPQSRARISAVLAVAGVVDVPLIVMATRWFRAIHPVSPSLEPRMRLALVVTVIGMSTIASLLVLHRYQQLRLAAILREMEATLDD